MISVEQLEQGCLVCNVPLKLQKLFSGILRKVWLALMIFIDTPSKAESGYSAGLTIWKR